MRQEVAEALDTFRDAVRKSQSRSNPNCFTPRSAYFPAPFEAEITNNLMSISTTTDIQKLIPEWQYLTQCAAALLEVVLQLQVTIRSYAHTATPFSLNISCQALEM